MSAPLAERMRPQTLDEYAGQRHLVGDGAVLRKSIESGNIPSMIFWGPPGIGKTTLAQVISKTIDAPFYTLSAISSGVKEVREVIARVKKEDMFAERHAILFIDEIHRFSKSQQDSLLGAVEQGLITLIGATTENPSFEVISALLSRCQVYILKPLEDHDLMELAKRAIANDEGLGMKQFELAESAAMLRLAGGDARKLYNILDVLVMTVAEQKIVVTDRLVTETVQQNMAMYDKAGEQHYDIISAFIKSIRGSDPNGAVYWLARMVEGGEDPKFIARRLLISASEDVGNANPTALVVANNCFQAVHTIGWPESRIILSQCATYLACSPKSNSSYNAINEAQQKVRETGDLPVPLHIRNAPTGLMKEMGYGKDYQYSHDFDGNFKAQEYLPDEIKGTTFFQPGENEREQGWRTWLKNLWKGKYNY